MILVTGGTGLVGAHLLYRLCQTQESVRAIYRTPESIEKTKILFELKNASSTLFNKIEWVLADLNDVVRLEQALTSVTLVYHCAALVSFDPKDDKALFQTNVDGTANLVNLCIAQKTAKEDFLITKDQLINNKFVLLQRGKKNYFVLVVKE